MPRHELIYQEDPYLLSRWKDKISEEENPMIDSIVFTKCMTLEEFESLLYGDTS